MSFWDSVFGSVPQVPSLPFTDPLAELTTLLGGEIKSWPEIEGLSQKYLGTMTSMLNEAIPGFSDIMKLGGIDTSSLLSEAGSLIKGEIPQDVQDAVFRSGALQGLMSGGGADFTRGLQARDIAQTSLGLMTQGANLAASGENAAQGWGRFAESLMLPPSANLYNPMDYSKFIAQMRASEQAIAQQQANARAAPNPGLQALNQWVEQVGGSVVSGLLGGKPGGNYMTSWQGAGGGQQGGGGFNWTGYNPSTGTTGGLNIGPWNIGGSPVPYLATSGMPSDVTNPGYSPGGGSNMFQPVNFNFNQPPAQAPPSQFDSNVPVSSVGPPGAYNPLLAYDPFNAGYYNIG